MVSMLPVPLTLMSDCPLVKHQQHRTQHNAECFHCKVQGPKVLCGGFKNLLGTRLGLSFLQSMDGPWN